MNKTYEVTLKLVGEARLIDVDGTADDAIDVASIRRDFGKIGRTICNSTDLNLMTPCKSLIVGIDKSLPEFMMNMMHLARDMELGKFRGKAFAEAVKDGVLCGGSLRRDVAPDVLRELDEMGLTTIAPLIASSKIN